VSEESRAEGFHARLTQFAQRRAAAASANTIEVTGTVERVRMFSDSWGVATLWSEERKEVKLTGAGVADLSEGADYVVTGTLRDHPKHGASLDVIASRPHVKLNERAIVKFIAATFKGIGERSAERYVKAVLEEGGEQALAEFRERLLKEPWAIDFGRINKRGTYAPEERDKTIIAFVQRDLATRLVGLPSNVLNALAARLVAIVAAAQEAPTGTKPDPVSACWAMLAQDPYAPIATVPGYGFASADAIGKVVNIPRDAPCRLAALVAHAVDERCDAEGHAFLSFDAVHASIQNTDPRVDPRAALAVALERETVALDDELGEARVYPARQLAAECKLASKIADLCQPSAPLVSLRDKALRDKVQEAARTLGGAFKNGMDASQVAALVGILTSRTRLHTITAEPGAGKTAVMEVLSKVLPGKDFIFCAPTGKGAKVLSNRVRSLGFHASTIHSLLQGESADSFAINATNPLDGDVLVVDEGSMPDLQVAAALLSAVNDGMHVVVLGDVDQLPSVAPGRFLADLLEIEQADHNRLDTVHRNSGGILDVIREVKAGKLQPRNRAGVAFSGTLEPASTGFATIVSQYVAAVGRAGYEGTALLMSRRKGDVETPGWNTTYANAVLREACNPNAPKVTGTALCVGDRIIIKANMKIAKNEVDPPIRVVNGDTGRIVSFETSKEDSRKAGASTIKLQLDDGRTIDFPGSASSALQLGYALTVHAAQGSEYKEVIAVITPGAPTFINRNMLYTGLSRARTKLQVYANDVDLRRIAATPMPRRSSGLVERVRRELDGDKSGDEEPVRGRSRMQAAA
jgi:exodeoxyribonuclease V alpha subunit